MDVVARRVSLAFITAVVAVGWLLVVVIHTGCPDSLTYLEPWTLGILVLCSVVAGLLGVTRHPEQRLSLTLLAALATLVWSFLTLARTDYLDPLPWSAGTIGVSMLVAATLGAGLLSGWQWWTLLVLPAAAIGFFHLSDALYDSGVECEPYHPAVMRGLLLVPAAIALGAVIARFVSRPARVAGAVLVLLPVTAFAWAGFRHQYPIDRQPEHPLMIRWLGGAVTFRGVAVDTATITDPRAATAAGVGIGDSLSVARSRYRAMYCFVDRHFKPECALNGRDQEGAILPDVYFIGDPIEAIQIGG